MGDLPAGNDKGIPNFAKHVEFLLNLENIVKDIIELGQGDDVNMMYLAYNSRTIGTIINKFPDGQILKLNKQGVTGRKRLENVLMKITEFRGEAQALEKTKSMLTSGALNKSRERYEADQQSGLGGNNPGNAIHQDDMDHQEEVHPVEKNQEGDYYDEDTGYMGVDEEEEDQQTDVEAIETEDAEDAAEQPGEM